MTSKSIKELFQDFTDEYIKFERVENKLSSRPDIHAFILLNELCPGNRDIISYAKHNEIWLDIDDDLLAKNATDEQIKDLHRCGVQWDSHAGCLAMFV